MEGYSYRIYNVAEYARLLNCLHDFYAPFEELLNVYMPALLFDYAQRRKAVWLVSDLMALGMPVVREDRPTMPVIQQPADAWGCFYVLEALQLGGAMSKKIIQSKGFDIPETALSFFAGYQQQNDFMWRTFLTRFNEDLETEVHQMAAAAAANNCYTLFQRNFQFHYSNMRM